MSEVRKQFDTLSPSLFTKGENTYPVMVYDREGDYVELSSATHQAMLYERYYDKCESMKKEIASLKQHNKELCLEIEIRDGMINDLQGKLSDSISKQELRDWVEENKTWVHEEDAPSAEEYVFYDDLLEKLDDI